nr:zinc ribbon domain-containing protein [Candidatus Freyarchaeota archaeon]
MAKKERKETIAVDGIWPVGSYSYKAPELYKELLEGFKQKRIIGSLCTGCGMVYVPPRNICGRCWRKIDTRASVSDVGTVRTFTISPEMKRGRTKILGVDPVEAGWLKEGERLIMVYVNFDGTNSNYTTILMNSKPEDVHIGMRVRAVWKEQPEGKLSDLVGVEPIK